MNRQNEEERGGANRPADASDGGDPDAVDESPSPAGWLPWSGGPGFGWLSGDDNDDEPTDVGWILALMVVVGVALFLFPEPVTSVVGLALVVVGTVGLLFHLSRRSA